jgi:hypothetical protein
MAMQSPPSEARAGRELSDAVQSALRRWARPTGENAEQAAREFLVLFQELEQDRSLGIATRQQLRLKVRTRLAQLAEQIAKRIAHEEPQARRDPPPRVALPADQSERLAQMGLPVGRQGAGQGRSGRGLGGRPVASRNFGPLDSAGQQLVELIQRTIAPSTWDVNGGPGTIYYWSPGRALVIRQTSEVHGDVADVLEQLERMSR